MPKVSPTTAPDFTEDERKWIEQHPFWRVVFMVLRLALVPLCMAGITTYFEYKSRTNDEKTEAAYKTVAPAVNTTQEELKSLQKEVDILRDLVVVLAQGRSAAPVASGSSSIGLGSVGTLGHGAGTGSGRGLGRRTGSVSIGTPVVESNLRPAVEQLQKSSKPAYTPRPLPASASDALQQMAK